MSYDPQVMRKGDVFRVAASPEQSVSLVFDGYAKADPADAPADVVKVYEKFGGQTKKGSAPAKKDSSQAGVAKKPGRPKGSGRTKGAQAKSDMPTRVKTTAGDPPAAGSQPGTTTTSSPARPSTTTTTTSSTP